MHHPGRRHCGDQENKGLNIICIIDEFDDPLHRGNSGVVLDHDEPSRGRARPSGSLAATVLALGLLSAIGPSCALGLPIVERADAPGLAGVYVVRPTGYHEDVHLRLIVLSGEADNRGT